MTNIYSFLKALISMKEFIKIKTISQVHEFFGLESPKHPLVSIIPINDQITNFNFGEATYLVNLYQISLKLGIQGSLLYGRNSYDFEEGTIVFTRPNQAIKIENNEDYQGSSGWTLMFHPDLIRKSELANYIDSYSFFAYDTSEALHLSGQERDSLSHLVSKIEQEYNQHIDKHSQELIIANIELLLKYCKRYYDRQFFTRSNLNKDIISKFEQVIKNYYHTNQALEYGVLTVNYCATQLNTSPNYLGDLLKNETGKNAKEHIQDYLIEKAKNQIINSNENISEIAYSLGFEHPQSFNKLFKAKTGMSPTKYRSIS